MLSLGHNVETHRKGNNWASRSHVEKNQNKTKNLLFQKLPNNPKWSTQTNFLGSESLRHNSLDWPQTCGDPPASASQVLGLQASTTTLDYINNELYILQEPKSH